MAITDVIALTFPCIVLAVVVYGWYRAARPSGQMSLRVARWMLGLAWRSRYRYLVFVALVGLGLTPLHLVIPMTSSVPIHPVLLLATAQVMLSLTMVMAVAQPPTVVLFAGSGEGSSDLFWSISLVVTPLRAVALLDYERARVTQRFDPRFNNLRTTNPNVWQSVVHQLAEIAPIVVVDTRDPGPAVAQEAHIMLAPERAGKALFVVGVDGSCPALVANGIDPHQHALRVVTEEDVIPALARILEQLPGSTSALTSEVTDARWKPHRPVQQDFEALPSVLLLAVGNAFDSRDAIVVARRSDKDLLLLLPSSPDISTGETWRRFHLLYEFLHDRRLVLMIVQPRHEVLIRNSFLVDVADQLAHHSGRNVGPLTFEELDKEDPVLRALRGFVAQLQALARDGALRYRVVEETGRQETWTWHLGRSPQ